MQAGKMKGRALFQERQLIDDGFGNRVGSWKDRFTRWCNLRFLRGSETVIAARLQGRQVVLVTIRRDSQTALITSDWRLLTGGREYYLTEPPRPADNQAFLEFLCEGGEPA